ncbi:MAG: DUF4129 domain-containing protein [Defluviitaleaceae bacterium]|nr:DUF4129 domain-containing protein [Defluviitaleaceae bacterium]
MKRKNFTNYSHYSNYSHYFLAMSLFASLLGSFMSMLDWGIYRVGTLSLRVLTISGLGDGFKLIFNRLFTISEQQQAYRYIMFTINASEYEHQALIAAALVVSIIVLVALSIILVFFRKKISIIVAIAFAVGIQIYFGVFPSAIWNIVLLTSLALLLVHTNTQGVVVTFVAVWLVAMGVWVTYPGTNPSLSAFSESIRDQFDIRISQITATPIYISLDGTAPDNRDLNVVDVHEGGLHESSLHDYDVDYDETVRGAEIGALSPPPSLVPVLMAIIAVLAAIAVARYAPKHWNVYKRRKRFETDDSATAINNMFIHMLEWLAVYGLERRNIVFSAYASQLSAIVSPEYSDEYQSMTALWRETMYSHHAPSEEERKQIKEFMYKTMDIVWKNSGIATRIKIKFHYYL